MIQHSFIHSFICPFVQQAFSERLLHVAFWSHSSGQRSPAKQGCTQSRWQGLAVSRGVRKAEGALCCCSRSLQAVSEPQLVLWWQCWCEAAAQASTLESVPGTLAGPRTAVSFLNTQPLNPNPDSRWNTYFRDNEVLLQIDKDVR